MAFNSGCISLESLESLKFEYIFIFCDHCIVINFYDIEVAIVDCLKIIEDKSSENRVYTPDARLIITTV